MNTPIVNAGLLYVNGLQVTKTGNKTFTIGAGAARNSTNENDIVLSSTITVNGATVGANGVDVAVLTTSSMYAVYLIGDSTGYNDTAAIMSLNTSTPSLPSGYDMFRLIDWQLTDGSSNVLLAYKYGTGSTRTCFYDVAISELSGGSSTSFAAIDIATSVPPIATKVICNITFTPDGATELAHFLPFGSSATNGIVQFGTGVAGAQVGMVTVPCQLDSGVPKILYKVASGDTLSLAVAGYEYYL